MSQLPSAALLGIGILLIAGCAERSRPASTASAQSYVCLLSDARSSAGSGRHITLRADERRARFLLRLGATGEWHPLTVIAGSDGLVYADAAYAWRPHGAAGVLTDIQAVQTYNCVGQKPARWSVR